MNTLLTDNSNSEPLLFEGAKTETTLSGQVAQHQSRNCANKSKPQDSGYTIIESLVAMIVVSVLMIAIAPVMAFSVATRVQARRTELAAMAGRAYIDGLRSGSINPKSTITGFPTKATKPGDFANEPPPASKDKLYCVPVDGKCDPDTNKGFYVQGAWLNDQSITTDALAQKNGYKLLVRVYRADSFAGGITLKGDLKDKPKQSIVGSGLGDRTMPVVEMVAEIPATGETPDKLEPYKSLCIRLKDDDDLTKCTY